MCFSPRESISHVGPSIIQKVKGKKQPNFFFIGLFTVLWYSKVLIPRGSAPWTPALPGGAAAGVREFANLPHSLIHQQLRHPSLTLVSKSSF
jgi:hypothetical protein